MEHLYVAVCEDKAEDQRQLLTLIQQSDISSQVAVFQNGESILNDYHPGIYDLIFMDVYLSGISGTETIRSIREQDPDVPVAFTTVSQEHALEAYRLDAIQYIEKPVSGKQVDKALHLAWEKAARQTNASVYIQGKSYSIPLNKLLYVEQKSHYIVFYFLDGHTRRLKGKLDELEPQLAGLSFFRCHKSYLANLAFVTGLDRELMLFYMKDGKNVYIRREDFKKAKNAWESWLFAAARKGGAEHEFKT